MNFRRRRTFPGSQFHTPAAHQVQRGDALRHPRDMVGRQLDDTMAETDPPGALTGGCEKDLRG
jgi:hypothetical protein